MVVELFAVALSYFIGWAYLRPVFYAFGWVLTAASAFPIGIAVWGLTAALSTVLPVRYDVGFITAVCISGILIFNWQRWLSPRAHEMLAFFSGLFVLLSFAGIFIYLDATGINTDSMFVLSVGKQLVEQGGLTDTMKGVLASFAIYLALIESAAVSLGLEYFRSILPLCLVSTLLLFLLSGLRALDIKKKETFFFNTLLVVLGIAVLASTYAFLWHGFFLKASPVYTLFLFICCSFTFFAERDGDARWLHAMVPVAMGTMLLRMEAGLTIMPMLVVLTAASNIPIKSRISLLVTLSLAILSWYSFLLVRSFGHGLFSVYELAVIGSLPAIFSATVLVLIFITKDRKKFTPDQSLKLMPWFMCAFLATFVIAYTTAGPETALSSLEALYCFISGSKAGVFYFWGGVLILLALAPFITQRSGGCWVFGSNAAGFILLILAITVIVPTKHCGTFDSVNRILTQIMPVLVFYVVLRYGAKGPFQLSRRRSAE